MLKERGKMNRGILKVLLILFFASLTIDVIAISPQQKKFGECLVETGTSTENILPLLANIAGQYGKYLEHIYGQDRLDYIIIQLKSNGRIPNVEKAEEMVRNTWSNILGLYPQSQGRIELNSSQSDLWDLVCLEFKQKAITKNEIIPNREVIKKRFDEKNKAPLAKFGLSENERKRYYNEYWVLKDKAQKEADKHYPGDMLKSVEVEVFLTDKYRKELLKKYKITEEQGKEIFQEGFQGNWYSANE